VFGEIHRQRAKTRRCTETPRGIFGNDGRSEGGERAIKEERRLREDVAPQPPHKTELRETREANNAEHCPFRVEEEERLARDSAVRRRRSLPCKGQRVRWETSGEARGIAE